MTVNLLVAGRQPSPQARAVVIAAKCATRSYPLLLPHHDDAVLRLGGDGEVPLLSLVVSAHPLSWSCSCLVPGECVRWGASTSHFAKAARLDQPGVAARDRPHDHLSHTASDRSADHHQPRCEPNAARSVTCQHIRSKRLSRPQRLCWLTMTCIPRTEDRLTLVADRAMSSIYARAGPITEPDSAKPTQRRNPG